MPRLGAEVYAAHMDNVLKLARRKGGVSRPQIIDELNITRAVANGLIEKAGLEIDRKEGRTEYFKAPTNGVAPAKPEVKQSKPVAAAEVAKPTSSDTGDTDLDDLAALDEQIVDTRNTLREAATKAGKALGEWATHQALVDALRVQLQELAAKRMSLSG